MNLEIFKAVFLADLAQSIAVGLIVAVVFTVRRRRRIPGFGPAGKAWGEPCPSCESLWDAHSHLREEHVRRCHPFPQGVGCLDLRDKEVAIQEGHRFHDARKEVEP